MSVTRFHEFMRAGNVAYAQGDREEAHYLWRRAANLDPHSEQVWLALLNVLDNEEDRRVCLQNIVAINPNNVQARERLQRTDNRIATKTAAQNERPELGTPIPPRPLWRVVLWWLEGALLGALLALAIILAGYTF